MGVRAELCTRDVIGVFDQLHQEREELHREIVAEQQEKEVIEAEISKVTERLKKAEESLLTKHLGLSAYNSSIEQMEEAFRKIQESSESLLLQLHQAMSLPTAKS